MAVPPPIARTAPAAKPRKGLRDGIRDSLRVGDGLLDAGQGEQGGGPFGDGGDDRVGQPVGALARGVLGERLVEPGRGGADVGVLGEAGPQQAGEFGVGEEFRAEVGLVMDGAVEHGLHGAGAEGQPAGGGVGEEAAEGEDVAGRFGGTALGLLGRDEAGGAEDGVCGGQGGVFAAAGDAEVDEAGPVHAEEHVAGFDVAVDEALRVHHLKGFGQGLAEDPYGAQRERSVGGDGLGQGGAGDEGGGQPRFAGVGVGAGDPYGPRGVDLGGDLGLAAETGPEVGLFGVFGADDLDGGERSVVGAAEVDDAHTAGAEPPEEAVAADPGRVRGVQLLHQPAAFPRACLACAIMRLLPCTTSWVRVSCLKPSAPLPAMATVTGPNCAWYQK